MRRSALIVATPEAEPLVSALRELRDPAARMGVPAHVTVLLPFIPADLLDEQSLDAVRDLFGREPGFPYRFDRVNTFGDATVYLEPLPAEAFVRLTQVAVERWPEYPPYGGEFDEIVPHLSVGDRLAAGQAGPLVREIRALLRSHGPITGEASSISLIVEDDRGLWSSVAEFPLGSRET
jgi:2'-5' RNA ligase superfamily